MFLCNTQLLLNPEGRSLCKVPEGQPTYAIIVSGLRKGDHGSQVENDSFGHVDIDPWGLPGPACM